MTPGDISKRVVADRLALIEQAVAEIQALPLDNQDVFFADSRNVWTAESCLRRSLEALLDLGRHVLAKGFGSGVTEYRDIPLKLSELGVLSAAEGALMRVLAGYRNRLVHLYHEVEPIELYDEVCRRDLGDVAQLAAAFAQWLARHPDALDEAL